MKNVTSTCVSGCESLLRPGHRRRVSREVSEVNRDALDPRGHGSGARRSGAGQLESLAHLISSKLKTEREGAAVENSSLIHLIRPARCRNR